MRLTEIYNIIDSAAPFSLSKEYCEKYGAHDNSGIIVDCGGEIDKILFSLDCSMAAAKRAVQCGAQLIVTHHPAVYYPVSSLKAGEPVFECVRAGISVISAHLNLDCAPAGIDDRLMRGLGGTSAEHVMHPLSCGGYGRVYGVGAVPFETFLSRIKHEFATERVIAYGDKPVKKVASFCGAGFDGESLAFAVENGADTLVSSDGKHHLVAEAAERGLNVVLLTHYAAEQYGFYRFHKQLKLTGVVKEYFADERLM